jgi:hypothetical protein
MIFYYDLIYIHSGGDKAGKKSKKRSERENETYEISGCVKAINMEHVKHVFPGS